MKGEKLTTDTKIPRIIRNYYEQLYAKKFDNLGKMDKFLEIQSSKTKSGKITENLNRQITTSETEAVIKKLLTHKSPGPDGFTEKFYPSFKELAPTIPRNSRRGKKDFQTLYEASIIVILKPGKDTTKKENYRPIFLTNIDAKILNKNQQTYPAIHEKDHTL